MITSTQALFILFEMIPYFRF